MRRRFGAMMTSARATAALAPAAARAGTADRRTGIIPCVNRSARCSCRRARAPNNAWALFGLSEVFKRRGDEQSERATRKLFRNAWVGSAAEIDIARL